MITKSIKLLFMLVIFVSCKNESKWPIASADQDLNDSNFEGNLDSLIQDYIDLDIFSGIVLVAENGKIKYQKPFGLADRDTNTPNTLTTLFDIGSMNKTFTMIVVKQLIAEGKLALDDKLVTYIPGFKDKNAKSITINHLLNHQSGFGDYHSPDYFDLPKEQQKLQAIVERAKSIQLDFKPGTEESYSNLGFAILGGVIEKVTGKSYFQNVNERIVEPLGLKDTYLNNFENLNRSIAKGYYYSPLGTLEVNNSTQDEPNPDGGFLSTTQDILKFYRSYYYDDLLLSKTAKASDLFFAYLKDLPKGKATGAAGGFEGFNTSLFQVISDDLSIIVFANMDEPVAEHIALDILTISRGETPNKPKPPAIQNVREAFNTHGTEYIKSNFEELTTNFHPTDPKDIILNNLGYAYLYGANDASKALQMFKLNTELFPNVANCWDSYGEVLAQQGNKNEAIAAYEKALKIRPKLESSLKALKELKKN